MNKFFLVMVLGFFETVVLILSVILVDPGSMILLLSIMSLMLLVLGVCCELGLFRIDISASWKDNFDKILLFPIFGVGALAIISPGNALFIMKFSPLIPLTLFSVIGMMRGWYKFS